ncbi:MAG: DUF4339 domain-containing protein [Myxococcales bacterium]|nr:DUF4339 domain-containing protein [Myxococcales bacterium]
MADHWYVLGDDGKPVGPLELASLDAQARAGKLDLSTKVNRAGTDDWVALGAVLKLNTAPNTRSGASIAVGRGQVDWLRIATLALVALLTGASGWIIYLLTESQKVARSDAAELRTLLEDQAATREKQRVEAAGILVNISATINDCYANNSMAECHVTNTLSKPIIACMVGRIAQKDSNGVQLKSMPMCTGPVRPLETKAVSAPWSGGRPVDMCNNVRGFLDWDKCTFSVENYAPQKE